MARVRVTERVRKKVRVTARVYCNEPETVVVGALAVVGFGVRLVVTVGECAGAQV